MLFELNSGRQLRKQGVTQLDVNANYRLVRLWPTADFAALRIPSSALSAAEALAPPAFFPVARSLVPDVLDFFADGGTSASDEEGKPQSGLDRFNDVETSEVLIAGDEGSGATKGLLMTGSASVTVNCELPARSYSSEVLAEPKNCMLRSCRQYNA